ncbi:hypothetical protein [Herbiconiux ginsengi]|uniref:DUF4190 domain-containing protein n=1 Tax=Herbiconiux ginsengi TaxID=381665 RepID=A0A1H3N5P4_9MICO|nr:hypothetical protein [Herbiconiux ginsengi]SDY84186.1 hypothetical protein SAMN05216554_1706 [Herbiconiux ginsengi]
MSQSALRTPPTGTDYPGKMLGIVGLVVAILANLIGLVISVIAYTQSKKAGYKNMPALIGVVVGAVFFVLTVVIGIVSTVAGLAASGLSY